MPKQSNHYWKEKEGRIRNLFAEQIVHIGLMCTCEKDHLFLFWETQYKAPDV